MLFSVVIPAYNAHKTLAKCLKSVYKQKFSDYEVIVVDDGSTDDTAKIAEEFSARVIKQNPNVGPAAARNISIKAAQGDIVVFIDADIAFRDDDALDKLAEVFRNRSDIAGAIMIKDKVPLNDGLMTLFWALYKYYLWNKPAEYQTSFTTERSAVKREVFDQVGYFNEKYKKADVEDFEFGYRLSELGYKMLIVRDIKVLHHFENFRQTTKKTLKRSWQWIRLFLKRKKFDPVYSSQERGIKTLVAAALVPLFLLIIIWPLFLWLWLWLIMFAVYIYYNYGFYLFLIKERKFIYIFPFTALDVYVCFLIAVGAGLSVLAMIFDFKKLSKNKYFVGLKSLFSPTPTYAILYVTARCNARCKMCFYWQGIDQAKQDQELSLAEIEKISLSLGSLQYLTLTGGEPTLRSDLPQIARTFDRNNNLQFLSIPTNSTLVDRTKEMVEEILRTTDNLYLKMCLSLDGLGQMHDEIRGVPGLFGKVLANYNNLAILKETVKDFEIMINMTVSSFNVTKVQEVMDFVRREMPKAVFDLSWTRGDARVGESKNMSAEDYLRVVSLTNQDSRNFSSGFSLSKIIAANKLVARDLIYDILKGKRRSYPCTAGRKMIIISEYGEVKPCEMLPYSFGNLRDFDYDIKKVLSTAKASEALNSIADKKCVCTFENAIQNSIVNSPSLWPRLLKKLFKNK
ncbi:MAG: glycosyltransferase [Candidatus Buchananbacteria bacterium]|nr:glycosyltransferase [Candidatus Buchananbacteria bacterium]